MKCYSVPMQLSGKEMKQLIKDGHGFLLYSLRNTMIGCIHLRHVQECVRNTNFSHVLHNFKLSLWVSNSVSQTKGRKQSVTTEA